MAFVLTIASELSGFHILSCVLAVIMLLSIFAFIFPKLVIRFKRKNTKFVNFLNFVAIILFSFIIVFLMASIIYFLAWGRKFWDNYAVAMYASLLLYLLVESYLNFIIKEKYKYQDY